MRINFRQGLVSSEIDQTSQPNYLTVNNSGITLRAVNRPIVFTLAEGNKNYTVTFHTDVLAWPTSLFIDVTEAWLWIDVNRATAVRTYGITTKPLTYSTTAPTGAVPGQHWFDRSRNVMRVYNENGSWQQVLRVFAGRYTSTTTSPVSYGTQVGLTGSGISGEILRDGSGRALTDSNGSFLTTEDIVLIDGASTHAAKLEANVDVAPARQPIAAYHVVRYDNDGWLIPADYDDVSECVLGLSTVDAVSGEPVSLVLQGKVYNQMWNWGGANITLWVNQHGELVETDPYDLGGRTKRRVPIARTIDSNTVIFDQGLGGVGEKGDVGDVSSIPLASATELGITRLSVEPEDELQPIAVGDNDPRLTDPRTPLEHTHPATAITVSPFGTFNGTNAQQALQHLQTVKLNLSGGTVTGPIVSTVQATQDTHLVTLGQARNEITARSVTERRHVLNDSRPTIVQAFNALSPVQRTLPVNTIVIVEWRGQTYVWSGGYGSPVSATDSGQFLLVGNLAGGEGQPLTFRLVEGVAAYKSSADFIVAYTTNTFVAVRNITTGTLQQLVLPQGLDIGYLGVICVSMDGNVLWVNVESTGGDENNVLKYTRQGDSWTHQDTGSYNWWVAGLASSPSGHQLAMVYQVFNSDVLEYTTNVLVVDPTNWDPLFTIEGVQLSVYEYNSYGTSISYSPNGELLAVTSDKSPTQHFFTTYVYDTSTGSEVARFENLQSSIVSFSRDGESLYILTGTYDQQELYVVNTSTLTISGSSVYTFSAVSGVVFRCVEVEGEQMLVGLGESTETTDLMFFKLNVADWTLTSMSATNATDYGSIMAFGGSSNVAVLRTSFAETSTTLIGTFDYEANILVDYNSVEWEDQQALSIHYAVVN